MFRVCISLNSLDLTTFDTCNATSSLVSLIDVIISLHLTYLHLI